MLQQGAEAIKMLTATDIGVAGIFIILVLDKVGGIVQKARNGKPQKDETKEYKILHPCKDDSRLHQHMEETRSALDTAKRCETSHAKLGDGINALVIETAKQTGLLTQIVKNGKKI